MYYKYYIMFLLNILAFSAIAQKVNSRIYYKGQNGESLIREPDFSNHFTTDFFRDSLTNQPYSGVATTWSYPYNSPNNKENCAADSMCIHKGTIIGYKKEYARPFLKGSKAIEIEFTDPSMEYNITTSNLLTPFNSKFKNVSSAHLWINLKNTSFYCEINYTKKNIKAKVEIIHWGTAIRKTMQTKQTVKLKDQHELEVYLKSFKDLVTQEMIDKCRRLGMFDNNPVEDPIINKEL